MNLFDKTIDNSMKTNNTTNKIGILIPSTSKDREWTTYKETYLFVHTLKSFFTTYDSEHQYVFYIGIDKDDKIYDTEETITQLRNFVSIMKNASIEFLYMDGIPKGHLTVMWNRLFEKAYNDNCNYFFQCGDDIVFKTNGWINDCIKTLQNNNDVGLVGPINNNPRILTQSFVSRKHMDLFEYYFPPEIVNWFCDDWINEVYKGIRHFFPLRNHSCINVGGEPRYDINNEKYATQHDFIGKIKGMRAHCMEIVKRDLCKTIGKI